MQDGQGNGVGRLSGRTSGGVAQFAFDVVARLVAGDATTTGPLRDDLVERFSWAVIDPELGRFEAMKPDLRRARISPTLFADRYVPEIARRLGKGWEDDTMSFAQVTMGASRLQAILREIGADWVADQGISHGASGDRATVLMIVPAGEQHTLGVFVLIGQLRRRGVSVCLRIGPSEDDLRTLLGERQFDGAMISVATPEKQAACRTVLKLLKDVTTGRLHVAVGGAALTALGDKADMIGADVVTNDLTTAMMAMGMTQAAMQIDSYADGSS
jgi:MerR family transcriptional regulator, light-induced transcriptional regulator